MKINTDSFIDMLRDCHRQYGDFILHIYEVPDIGFAVRSSYIGYLDLFMTDRYITEIDIKNQLLEIIDLHTLKGNREDDYSKWTRMYIDKNTAGRIYLEDTEVTLIHYADAMS